MTRNTWIIFAVICAVLAGGLIWTSRGDKTDVDETKVNDVQSATESNGGIADHTYGNPDAKVVIIEYADYNCPGCKVADPAIKAAVDTYKNDVLLVMRNFPLPTLHPNARAAAAAAEAAGLQDKYLEMHNRLYETSTSWQSLSIQKRSQAFDQYATEIGLDIKKFRTDMESDSIKSKINYDVALGKKAGVTGTPGIFVNGKSANTYLKDGKIVPESTKEAQPAWASTATFIEFELLPALKKAGVTVTE